MRSSAEVAWADAGWLKPDSKSSTIGMWYFVMIDSCSS
jgi:hypothetical protein